jgi:hypothetical protein
VILQFGASLTDDTRSVNYDCNMFIIQAIGHCGTNRTLQFVLRLNKRWPRMSSLLLLWPKSQGTLATKIANVNMTKTKKTNYLQVVKIGVKVLKEIHFQLQILLDKK